MADGKAQIGNSSYRGKRGCRVSVEANVREVPITILSLTQTRDGRLKFLAAEGESLAGERLKIGNTNSRLRFALHAATFMNARCQKGPTHHYALGISHVVGKLKKVGSLLGVELKVVDSGYSRV